jgi:Predicted inhibitor of MCP methylation, homolog of CheC
MRLDFVKVFRDSTSEMLQQIVGPVDEMDSMSMHAVPLAGRDVTAVIELDGQAQGRVIFDMDSMTAMRIAGRLLDEPPPVIDPHRPERHIGTGVDDHRPCHLGHQRSGDARQHGAAADWRRRTGAHRDVF